MENFLSKIRKKSAELRMTNHGLAVEKVDKNSPKPKKGSDKYSILIKNLVRSKRVKNFEKRKKKEYGEKRRQIFLEKFNRNYKQNETFQSTTKNPKINEILRKLKESQGTSSNKEENKNNIGKIDNNKINKFLESDSMCNNKNEIMSGSKVKDFIAELNKNLNSKNDNQSNYDKKNNYIPKKNKINNKVINNDDTDKKENNIDKEEDNKLEGDNYNSLQDTETNQELNKKSNIVYRKFKFNYFKIKDKKYKMKQKSKKNELIPKNQINFTIISQIEIQKQEIRRIRNSIKKGKINERNNKIKVKKKKNRFK